MDTIHGGDLRPPTTLVVPKQKAEWPLGHLANQCPWSFEASTGRRPARLRGSDGLAWRGFLSPHAAGALASFGLQVGCWNGKTHIHAYTRVEKKKKTESKRMKTLPVWRVGSRRAELLPSSALPETALVAVMAAMVANLASKLCRDDQTRWTGPSPSWKFPSPRTN